MSTSPTKRLLDYWPVLLTAAGLLVNIGTNIAMLATLRADVTSLKTEAIEGRDANVTQDLKLRELDLRVAEVQSRVTSNEVIQRSDHDALIRMVGQVERIAKWVDEQEQGKGREAVAK